MRVDTALREFAERYDRDAMMHIERLANDRSFEFGNRKFNVFNLKEGFEKFTEFMDGYAQYRVENLNNAEASPMSVICENVAIPYIGKLFEDVEIPYHELTSFVQSYWQCLYLLNSVIQ